MGPDGAGKTTLIRLLATVLSPSGGDAEVFGVSVRRHPDRVTPHLGYMPQHFSMYPDLTVAENVEFFARLRGVDKAERRQRAARLLGQLGLSDFSRRRSAKLSGGMKQKLMLASVLMHEPDLLLLDEPTTGVDPVSRREFWEVIALLRDSGKTVLVATPYMDETERCTHVAFIDAGKITRTGTPAELKASVPGVLLRVLSANPYATVAALEADAAAASAKETGTAATSGTVEAAGQPTLRSVHVFGDEVRAFAPDAAIGSAAVAESLAAAGLSGNAEVIEMDMESAFVALAEFAPEATP
jgi:ABC-2 type transport system ATP-binding protein